MQEHAISSYLFNTVVGKPKLSIAIVFLVLAALATTLSYSAYLVVGVLADLLDSSRFIAGLLLGIVFARFPMISKGRMRIAGLLPAVARRPLMVVLLALCLVHFLAQGDGVPAAVVGFTVAFLLLFPWLKKALFARVSASLGQFGAVRPSDRGVEGNVIEGEFRERKE